MVFARDSHGSDRLVIKGCLLDVVVCSFYRMRKREKLMTHLKRILIVDDSHESRSILGVILHRSWGYETIEATTGTEAVKKAIAEKPDLIIMDLGLPGISGVDATKAIKDNSTTAHIPIIASYCLACGFMSKNRR